MNAARNIACVIVAVASLGSTASGQSGESASSRGGRCLAVPVDTAEGFVYGSLEPDSPDAKVDRERLLDILGRLSVALSSDTLTLQPVAQLFDVVITAMGRPGDPRPMIMPRWAGHPAVATEIALTLEPTGALTNARVVVDGDSAVAATLRRAIAATRSVAPTAAEGPQRLRLRLSLTPDSAAIMTPVVAARQLTVHGTPPRQRLREGPPMWPRSQTRSGQHATVLAWYVVDARGSTVAASFGAVGARHEPATVGGCPTSRIALLLVRFDTESR